MKLHIIFGSDDIKRIEKCISDNVMLFVYEPYKANFENYGAMLPKSKNVRVLVEYTGDMVDYLMSLLAEIKPEEIFYEVLDKYDATYPVELDEFQDAFDDAVQIYQTNIETAGKFGEIIKENESANKKAILLGKPLSSIAKKGDTAFIIAAGPSLDKNISELKNAHGMIIATDTAINPLLDNGIAPHLAVSIDAGKSVRHFSKKESRRIPLVCRSYTNREIMRIHKGRKYFAGSNVLSGGSVTTDAIHIASLIGYKKIVFVGLDLAYTGGEAYAAGTLNKGMTIDDAEDICSDSNGNMIPTSRNLSIYRKWIERFIKCRPGIEFYDCTEGGARIAGAKIMSLREFINTEGNS